MEVAHRYYNFSYLVIIVPLCISHGIITDGTQHTKNKEKRKGYKPEHVKTTFQHKERKTPPRNPTDKSAQEGGNTKT
jgi:hypothetical protein